MEFGLARQTGRFDRHVRRSYLRMGEGASRHRISYSLEEALRLANLPGEEEGRIYCFRRVSFVGIPADANRKVWMERVQQALSDLSMQSVHASAPNADRADAIYFNNLEEALETLLYKALHAPGGAAWARPEWFSASLLGVEAETGYRGLIPAIVERLPPAAIAPGVAAAMLFAALGEADPSVLLSAIPTGAMREWVRELEGQSNFGGDAPPLQLPDRLKTTLQRAAVQLGWKDPGTVWLAVQAVLSVSPNMWASGTAVKRARTTLRMLEGEQSRELPVRSAFASQSATAQMLVFDDDGETGGQDGSSLDTGRGYSAEKRVPKPAQHDGVDLSSLHSMAGESPLPETVPFPGDVSEVPLEVGSPVVLVAEGTALRPLLGAATSAAGLFFLLNALRHAGIVAALDSCPDLAEAGLAAHILKRLAVDAGVDSRDPILLCLRPLQEKFIVTAEVLADLPQRLKAWPVGFAVSSRAGFDSQYFLRVWALAVTRWCWRTGRLTVGEIVQRKGRIWQTRSDLDVTLPLAGVDIRIRRIGLDIDPGWLPWFGEFGRVVRFHYRDREPERREC